MRCEKNTEGRRARPCAGQIVWVVMFAVVVALAVGAMLSILRGVCIDSALLSGAGGYL